MTRRGYTAFMWKQIVEKCIDGGGVAMVATRHPGPAQRSLRSYSLRHPEVMQGRRLRTRIEDGKLLVWAEPVVPMRVSPAPVPKLPRPARLAQPMRLVGRRAFE